MSETAMLAMRKLTVECIGLLGRTIAMIYALPTIDNRSSKPYKTENEILALSGMTISHGITNLSNKEEFKEKVAFIRLQSF